MILDPGSFYGKRSYPNPLLGPLPKNLISFAILNKLTAIVFKLPWNSTIASFVAKDSNLLGAVTNGWPVYSEIAFAIASSKPLYAFKPVPTAVPPWAN